MNYRNAEASDLERLFELVKKFAASFVTDKNCFVNSFEALLRNRDAKVIVAHDNEPIIGYLLGFRHHTFYANGMVGWVEEIMVEEQYRRSGIGAGLMRRFEEWIRKCNGRPTGLATRRAAPFYTAIGYEDSAVFFRKVLDYN